nr:MAG TPA: hypothetical protein [Caudoviricetes sp.]DAY79307.1 MAG TPA: hypothetical protein [Caudoviricetes sp.]
MYETVAYFCETISQKFGNAAKTDQFCSCNTVANSRFNSIFHKTI